MRHSYKIKSAAAAVILSMVTFGAAAQNDSIMDIRPQGSELRIEAAGFGITIGQGETPRYSASYHRRARQPRVTTSLGIASIDLGFNTLPDVRYYGPWAGQGDFLDIRAGKSIRFAWEPAAVEVSLDRRGIVSLIGGLRLSADNYMFSEPYTISRNQGGVLMPEKLDGYIKKSKLTATYIGIPVRLSFSVGGKLDITGYASADMLLNAHTKYKKPKVKDNIPGLSPWRISAGGCLTFCNIGIYCDYSITPLFKEGTGADAHTVSIGLRFGI